jgi:peptidoglycan hydrolase-like protein with peptidoglycan-binding domain/DNA invertase Pin-like site-specific DNA recombinase
VAVAALAAPAAYGAGPDLAAGWHGREIRDPRPADADVAQRPWPRGWSAGAVRLGTGYAHASRRVREVQRRLRARGYRTGRVDGRFGPRTRAAVTWFQIKHGLKRTGTADRATVTALRTRPAESAATALALPAPLEHVATSNGLPTLALIAILLALAALGFLVGAMIARRPRRDEERAGPAGREDARRRPETRGEAGDGEPRTRRDEAAGEESRRQVEARGAAGGESRRRVEAGGDEAAREPSDRRVAARGAGGAGAEAARWDRGGPQDREEPRRLVAVPAPAGGMEERPTRVLGYVLTPAGESPAPRLQEGTETIASWCVDRGWELAQVVHDVESSQRRRGNRPGLDYALQQIADSAAVGLVCVRLSDLSDSVADLGSVLQAFVDREAFLVALDYDIDTSTAPGALATRALLEVGGWERARNDLRSRRGLEAVSGRGSLRDHLQLSERIAAMRARGMSLQAIADTFNAEGVPTIRGGSHWRPSSVQAAAGYKRPTARGGA